MKQHTRQAVPKSLSPHPWATLTTGQDNRLITMLPSQSWEVESGLVTVCSQA